MLNRNDASAWSCPGYPAAVSYVVSLLALVFGVSHTMVLLSQVGGENLVLQDGLGWQLDVVGRAVFETLEHTFAELVMSSAQPVVIQDLRTETRFPVPPPLLGYGLVSGLCVRIPVTRGRIGILAVFSTQPRTFTHDEIATLNALAGMLAISLSCKLIEMQQLKEQEMIEQAKQEWEATVDALPHFICLLDKEGHIVRANRSLELWVRGSIRDIRGSSVHEVLHPGCCDQDCYMHTTYKSAWNDMMRGQHVVFEVDDKVINRKLEIQLRSITSRSTLNTPTSSLAVLVMHDITRIKHAEEFLKNNNAHLEDLVNQRTNALLQVNEQLWHEIMERRRVEENLRRSENDMKQLSAQILTAQEVERKRIAAELHDGISQSLTAIKFSIESAFSSNAFQVNEERNDLVETILSRIQNAIEEVYRISTNLRPTMLDDLGIIPTIAWFCREFRSIYNDILLKTNIQIVEEEIPVTLKTVIYRILQEALNNIVKHSLADDVTVSLRKTDSIIEFVVQDNGIGFEPNLLTHRNSGRKGAGVNSMRERAEFSGGTFSVQSRREVGTVIRVVWPM